MINYGATLDVSGDLVWFVAGVLRAERLRRGTRRGRPALTPYRQAVLVLRWFRDAVPVHRLATDHRISIATAYRYLHEAITALAAQAPDLHQVLAQRRDTGDTHVVLDGSLFTCDRVAATTTKTKGRNRGVTVHLWYSGKHRCFGGNIQFLASPGGFPLRTSPVLPGSRNDLPAARDLDIAGALTAAAVTGLPTPADHGIFTPIKTHDPAADRVRAANGRHPGSGTGRPGRDRQPFVTGRWRRPRMIAERRRSAGPVWRRSGKRVARTRNATSASRRASGAPRQ